VSADVSINSLHLTDADIGYFDSRARLTPVLRQQRDREALQAALAEGIIDALVSDHNPVEADAKNLPFGEAEAGATGLELLLSLALKWAEQRKLGTSDALARITAQPSNILSSSLGTLASSVGRLSVGGAADICVFDPLATWSVTPEMLRSQGKHTPFAHEMSGSLMLGRVRTTLVSGHVAFESKI
jgi:dihydroorotase